jgi:hypothetical protein
MGPGAPADAIRRSFDDLGRLIRVENTNLGLTWLPEAARTVLTEVGYDPLDRVSSEQTTPGGTMVATAFRRWMLSTPDLWQRLTITGVGPWARTVQDDFDEAGRLASTGPVGPLQPALRFRGSVISTPVDPNPSSAGSRSTEEISHDGFGLVDQITYGAVGVDGAGQPLDAADANRYCPPGWDPAICAAPLLSLGVTRDGAGRTALEMWRHGHRSSNPAAHCARLGLPIRLRGYQSTLRRHLALMWEDDNRNPTTPPTPTSYTHTEANLRAAITGATAFSYAGNAQPRTCSPSPDLWAQLGGNSALHARPGTN